MGILSIILIVFVNIKLFKINSSKKKSKSPDQPRFQGKENKVHLLMGREACAYWEGGTDGDHL